MYVLNTEMMSPLIERCYQVCCFVGQYDCNQILVGMWNNTESFIVMYLFLHNPCFVTIV